MSSTCHKCRQTISGQVVTAMDAKWHNECFVCYGCRVPLSGKTFHNKDGVPYCLDCRRAKFDPTCQKCMKKIDPTVKFSIYNDKTFHKECFVCAQCRQPLEGKKFNIKDGLNYCADHH